MVKSKINTNINYHEYSHLEEEDFNYNTPLFEVQLLRDPQKVVLPEQPALSGAALADFRLAARPLLTQLDSATNPKTAAGPTVARSGGRL